MIRTHSTPGAQFRAAAFLALGIALLALTFAPAQAQAQETPQETPWYMPQPWVHPPATGPAVHPLPGYYGNSFSYAASPYGSFGNGCYGKCGSFLRGTIATGSGVVLFRPTVAIYDQRAYQIVPRGYVPPTRYVVLRAPARAAAAPRPAKVAARKMKPLPQFSIQNGVRIIRPLPMIAN